MLIGGAFPKAGRDAGSFSHSFQGSPFLQAPSFFSLRRGCKKGRRLWVSVRESSLYLPPANPPKKWWILGFPLGAGIAGCFIRGTRLPLREFAFTVPSATPFRSQLSLWKRFRVALTATSASCLAAAFGRQPRLVCWQENWAGDAFCIRLCVVCVCLVSVTLWGRRSWTCCPPFAMEEAPREGITWAYTTAFCHFLSVFQVWPGRVMLHLYPVSKKTIREKAK